MQPSRKWWDSCNDHDYMLNYHKFIYFYPDYNCRLMLTIWWQIWCFFDDPKWLLNIKVESSDGKLCLFQSQYYSIISSTLRLILDRYPVIYTMSSCLITISKKLIVLIISGPSNSLSPNGKHHMLGMLRGWLRDTNEFRSCLGVNHLCNRISPSKNWSRRN